jgi:hypothetical protein
MNETPARKTKACQRCTKEKVLKAKGLCNACYTTTCRENAKKKKGDREEDEAEQSKPNMQDVFALLLKQQEENLLLRQKLDRLQNTPTLNKTRDVDVLVESIVVQESTLPSVVRTVDIVTESIPPPKELSLLFVEEMQTKVFEYDQDKYKAYLVLVKKKKKWFGLGEEKLVELFPCFSLLVQKYYDKMLGKRSKQERDLIKEGKVESKSLVETKGRIVTSAGQFFLLLQQIKPQEKDSVEITELFDTSKIKVFIQFLEELGREPCTIRNVLLTLKFIIKAFLGSSTFQAHQKEMIQASTFLDLECSLKKGQDFNKSRPNEEDLMQAGHFMEKEEFSLLVIYLLKRIQELIKVEKKSLDQVFELQDLCYSTIALLDGGLRREVMCRLRVDSLIIKNGGGVLSQETNRKDQSWQFS